MSQYTSDVVEKPNKSTQYELPFLKNYVHIYCLNFINSRKYIGQNEFKLLQTMIFQKLLYPNRWWWVVKDNIDI